VGEAGESGEERGGDELGLVAQLHSAGERGEIYVAATLADAEQGALDLDCSGKDGRSGVGDAEAAVGVSVKAERRAGMLLAKAGDDLGDFFGACAAGGIADDEAADLLSDALGDEFVEVFEAPFVEGRLAGDAVFAAAAASVQGVFQIDDDFEAIGLQEADGFGGHAEVLFGGGFEGAGDVEEAGFNHYNGDGDAFAVPEHELDIGPIFDADVAAAGAAKEREFHCAGIDAGEGGREIADELVGSGKADFGVGDAKGGHALEERDCIRDGYFEVWLLETVAQTGVEELDLVRACLIQLTLLPAEGARTGAYRL